MKKHIEQLQKSMLFSNISAEDIKKMCTCLQLREKKIEKDEFVFHAGDVVNKVYLVISGSMHIVDEDFWGNRSLIETMPAYTLFGEAYAISNTEEHLVSVVAAEDAVVLELEPSCLTKPCPRGCECHIEIIRNTEKILSIKIIRLTEKLGHIMKRSTKEKVCSYLSKCARKNRSNRFCIPYSRQELADYLCVERSALSHELSKMTKHGIIRCRRNEFELLKIPNNL